MARLHVAVVGSGPSGFYTTKYLLREERVTQVTLIERLPSAYGLVRFGVAPDHPEVKNVIEDFESVAKDPRFCFLGNVSLGDLPAPPDPDQAEIMAKSRAEGKVPHSVVTLDDLRRTHDAVVLAFGADSDRALGLPGHDLEGVLSARAFVNWYNGHPEYSHLTETVTQALRRHPEAVVLGHGNVALDCARILAKAATTLDPGTLGGDAGALAKTDITTAAADALSGLAVDGHALRGVHLVGRRGAGQAAFTIKELRELTKLATARLRVWQHEVDLGATLATQEELDSSRPKTRLHKLVADNAVAALGEVSPLSGEKAPIDLRFLQLPTRVVESETELGAVAGLAVRRAALEGAAHQQRAVPVDDAEEQVLPCGLLLTAIGWKSVAPSSQVPFDERRAVVPSRGARVVATAADGAAVVPGVYVAGWLKRGPSGIIGSNISDAREAAAAVLDDFPSTTTPPKGGADELLDVLSERLQPGSACILVDWTGHQRMSDTEVKKGESRGKPREKFTTVRSMLAAAVFGGEANPFGRG